MSLYTGFGDPTITWHEDEQVYLAQYKNGCTTNPTEEEIIQLLWELCS